MIESDDVLLRFGGRLQAQNWLILFAFPKIVLCTDAHKIGLSVAYCDYADSVWLGLALRCALVSGKSRDIDVRLFCALSSASFESVQPSAVKSQQQTQYKVRSDQLRRNSLYSNPVKKRQHGVWQSLAAVVLVSVAD